MWAFNIIGTVDLLNAFYQGNRLGVGMAPGLQGAAYFISTVLVPLLLVTHVLVSLLRILVEESMRRSAEKVANARSDQRTRQWRRHTVGARATTKRS